MNYIIDTTTEQLNNTAGITLAGKIAKKIQLISNDDSKKSTISDIEVIRSMFGLLIQGRTSFEEIELFRNDSLFKNSLELKYVPASETLRLYLERISNDNKQFNNLTKINHNLLKDVKLTPITTKFSKYIPVDCDVSPFNNSKSNKEGVSRTYKGFDGYAPIFTYIGREGYMLDCELREGKQHCQNGTNEYLKRNLNIIKKLNLSTKILFRLDSGNDSKDTLKTLSESGHYFLIKRNLRKELPDYWLDHAKVLGEVTRPREGKIVYTGVLTGKFPANEESLPAMDIVFQVTERKIDKNGNLLLFPDIEIETWWTNLYEDPQTVIKLYHDHGTSEQFHSELKTDMDVEKLPSGKFEVNKLILKIAMIAFNSLRLIGQLAIEHSELLPYKNKVNRKRLRKVISDLIFIACKIISHSRKTFIKFWDKNPWYPIFSKIYSILSY